jgi:hypothetical protein
MTAATNPRASRIALVWSPHDGAIGRVLIH